MSYKTPNAFWLDLKKLNKQKQKTKERIILDEALKKFKFFLITKEEFKPLNQISNVIVYQNNFIYPVTKKKANDFFRKKLILFKNLDIKNIKKYENLTGWKVKDKETKKEWFIKFANIQ